VTSENSTDINDQESNPTYPTLSIDWDLYSEYLEDSDLTDDQKREFIQTLWNIVVSFVDLGFGIHPMQQAYEENDELSSLIADTVLSSDHPKQTYESKSKARDDNSAELPTDSK
jgi:hypothetical protein